MERYVPTGNDVEPISYDIVKSFEQTPLSSPAFYKYYLGAGDGDPVLSQPAKDMWSQRIDAPAHWHYDETDVRPLRFQLPRAGSVRFHIEISLNGWVINLGTGTHQLGHNDQAHFAPCALRWDEVSAYVSRIDEEHLRSACALLLLPFVGSDDQAEVDSMRSLAERSGKAFKMPTSISKRAVIPMNAEEEEEVRWEFDSERGLLLHGEYLGYTRRACDFESKASFPWEEFRKLRTWLELEDHPAGVPFHQHGAPEHTNEAKKRREKAKATADARAKAKEEARARRHPLLNARVRHSKFGAGLVYAVQGSTPEGRASVRFDDGKERVIVESYLSLE